MCEVLSDSQENSGEVGVTLNKGERGQLKEVRKTGLQRKYSFLFSDSESDLNLELHVSLIPTVDENSHKTCN